MRKYLVAASGIPGYAERLCRSLEKKSSFCLMPAAACSAEEAVSVCRTHPVSVILADEGWLRDGCFSGLPGNPRLVALTDNADPAGSGERIYCYQGVDGIVRQLTEICGETSIAGPVSAGRRAVKMTAVYSPSLPSLKTAFAMTLAAMQKRLHKTLYLNLEEFGGCGSLLRGNGEKNLSDAVYYLKQSALDSRLLASMIVTSGSVDYIPPMPYADDVKEAGGEEWIRLLARIAEISDYEEIIADLPQSLYIAADVIDACDELYIPVGGDSVSRAKTKELEEYMSRPEHRRMREKARKIRICGGSLPDAEESGDYPEELMYGTFGEEILREVPFERK